MSSTMLMALALALAVALVAIALWCASRWRPRRDDTTPADSGGRPQRFNTTLGELRDMREALGTGSAPPRRPS